MGQTDNNASSLSNFDFDDVNDWFEAPAEKPKKDVTSVMSRLKEEGIKNTKIDDESNSGTTNLETTPDTKQADIEADDDADDDFTTSDFGDDDEDEVKKDKDKVKSDKTKVETKKTTKVEEKTKPAKAEKEEEEDEEDDDEDDEEFYTNLAVGLKEEGLFTKVELKEGKKLSKDDFKEKFEEELELRLEEELDAALDEFVGSMDEDAKKFISFKKKGGNTADFLRTIQKAPPISALDVDDEGQVKKVILHHLTTVEGKDADEAEDQYDYWKTSGKHVTKAEKFFEQDKKATEKAVKEMDEARKAAEKKKKEDAIKFADTLENTLSNTDSIKGIALTKEDKKALKPFINKPSVEAKGKIYPPLLAKINATLNPQTEEDWQNLLLLAKLYKDNFKLPDVEVEAETKVADRVIRGIDNAKKGLKRTRTSRVNGGKSLVDRFAD